MGVQVLILGESGTGKTTSLRNFKKGELAVVNVAGKPLPFRGEFETLSKTTDVGKILQFMKQTKAKSIVIDDCQYVMAFQYMRRIKETGWDKFNEIQSDFFNLIDAVPSLPDDVIVYFLSHIETRDDGRQKIKTIGKMLDEKITIEGMFGTVLKTHASDGKYYFLTQNSGNDTVKSPMGMFDTFAIDNDLKYVDEKIRNYYHIGEYKSDEEMEKEDAEAERPEIEKEQSGGRRGRTTRSATRRAEPVPEVKLTTSDLDDVKPDEVKDDDLPFGMDDGELGKEAEQAAFDAKVAKKFEECVQPANNPSDEPAPAAEQPKRRQRRVR